MPLREGIGSLETVDCGDICGLLVLLVDFTEAASDLSSPKPAVEPLGLSLFLSLPLDPGILERIEPLRDRIDSLVSVRENDGYDCSGSPERSPGFD